MKSLILVALIVTGLVWQIPAKAGDDWQKTFYTDLQQISSKDYQKEPSLEEVGGAIMQSSSKIPDLEAPALFRLWLSDHEDEVELRWWTSRNRSTRALTVALYYCAFDLSMARLPAFQVEAGRFQPDEAKERKEEVDFVLTHRGEIAGILAKCTENIPSHKSLHEHYVLMFDDYRHGKGGKP